MPKKKNASKKRKVREIKKKKTEIKKEESDLEKDIEETEDVMEESEFREFLQPTQISAPVLTKVETSIQEPLESTIVSSPMTETKEKETGVDYVAASNTRNEPKYSNVSVTNDSDEKKYESEFRPPVLRQTESRRLRQETTLSPKEVGINMDDSSEGIETTTLEQRRTEPFETQEKKYREVKL